MKAIPREFQHALVLADIDKKNKDCNWIYTYCEKIDKFAKR